MPRKKSVKRRTTRNRRSKNMNKRRFSKKSRKNRTRNSRRQRGGVGENNPSLHLTPPPIAPPHTATPRHTAALAAASPHLIPPTSSRPPPAVPPHPAQTPDPEPRPILTSVDKAYYDAWAAYFNRSPGQPLTSIRDPKAEDDTTAIQAAQNNKMKRRNVFF